MEASGDGRLFFIGGWSHSIARTGYGDGGGFMGKYPDNP
jgi:hypothetical protein